MEKADGVWSIHQWEWLSQWLLCQQSRHTGAALIKTKPGSLLVSRICWLHSGWSVSRDVVLQLEALGSRLCVSNYQPYLSVVEQETESQAAATELICSWASEKRIYFQGIQVPNFMGFPSFIKVFDDASVLRAWRNHVLICNMRWSWWLNIHQGKI